MSTTQIKNGFNGGSDAQLLVNADGSINVNSSGGGDSNVNIHDSAGNSLTSTAGALNVNTSGSSTVSGTVNTNLNGLTNFQTSQYIVGTSAIQLTVTPLSTRSSMSIKAQTTSNLDIIYVGNSSSVTTSTGYPLFNGDSLQLDLTPSHQVWVIGTTSGQLVYVLEIGS